MITRAVFQQHEADMLNWYWFSNGFSKEDINLVHETSSTFPYTDAITFGNAQPDEAVRKSRIKWLSNSPKTEWLYDKLMDLAVIANKELWNFDLVSMVDSIQYTEYHEGGGHYGYHLDIGAGSASLRKVSIVVQLSDPADYDGGQFEVLRGMNPEPLPNTQGAVLLFPSYVMHRVTPVTRGTRRSLVIWVGGSHYR
jgi:PKHD-type hydroxylase